MENSIKEDIKIVENYLANSAINEIDSNFFKNSGWETVDLEIPKSMQHILPDYKRVLKENEYMHNELNKQQTTINKYAKENEELKETYKSEKKMKNEYVKLYQDLLLKENVIPIQKIKDKIEEILNNGEYRIIFEGDAEFPDEATCIDAQKYIKLEKLQELLEGRK